MDERLSAAPQVAVLADQLARATEALSLTEALIPTLYGPVKPSFDKALENCHRSLEALRKRGGSHAEQWAELRVVRAACGELFREALAMAQGAWARDAGLDGGLCVLADHLLREIDGRAVPKFGWDRITVLAGVEFYGELAQMVRVKFPDTGIWNLAVAAHEFAHFALQRVQLTEGDALAPTLRHPVAEVLRQVGDKSRRERLQLEELLADAFATYATGPAYPAVCLLLRFSPLDDTGAGMHPSSHVRAHLMLQVLDAMDMNKQPPAKFHPMTNHLRRLWRGKRRAAGLTEVLDDKESEVCQQAFALIYPLLERELSSLRYRSYGRAQALSLLELDDRPAPKPGDILPDVLNAAWLRRVRQWETAEDLVPRIGDWANARCADIVARTA